MTETAVSPLATADRQWPPAPRRTRRIVTKALIFLMALAVAGAGVLLANYQPLDRTMLHTTAGECTEKFGDFTSYRGDTYAVWDMTCHRKGDVVTWGLSFENTAPVGVKIVGITPPRGPHMDVPTTWVGRIINHYPTSADMKPFEPFVAEPGAPYAFEFRSTLRFDCIDPKAPGITGHTAGAAGAAGVSYKLGPLKRHDTLLMTPQLRIECGIDNRTN